MDLNGCAVLILNNNPYKGKILWIEWAWTDNPNISKKGFKMMEDLAQKVGAGRIAGAMTRGFKAISRKYGFKEVYRVMEKEVKTNVEKD